MQIRSLGSLHTVVLFRHTRDLCRSWDNSAEQVSLSNSFALVSPSETTLTFVVSGTPAVQTDGWKTTRLPPCESKTSTEQFKANIHKGLDVLMTLSISIQIFLWIHNLKIKLQKPWGIRYTYNVTFLWSTFPFVFWPHFKVFLLTYKLN